MIDDAQLAEAEPTAIRKDRASLKPGPADQPPVKPGTTNLPERSEDFDIQKAADNVNINVETKVTKGPQNIDELMYPQQNVWALKQAT